VVVVHCVAANASDMQTIADLDRMIAHSLRDQPDDESDDMSDTDDPDLLVSSISLCQSTVLLLHFKGSRVRFMAGRWCV